MIGRNDIILIFIFFFFFDHIGYTEGTKQTTPYSAPATCDLWLLKVYYNNVDPFGCSAADTNHSIFVTIKSPGEKLYFGFSNFFPYATWVKLRITLNGNVVLDWINLPSSPGPGFIANWNQANAGPNVLNPTGYSPLEFTPDRQETIELNLIGVIIGE